MMITDKKPIGLYIHIPFCKSKCPYCDFYSFVPKDNIKERYIESLKRHLNESNLLFDTVYFGGGTPSLLGSTALADILNNVNRTNDCEITVECNPSDVGTENNNFSFEKLKDAGVNRISMGLQSAVDDERKKLGRISGKNEVLRAIEKSYKAGIENISLDLMIGIPDQTEESLLKSIDFCVSSGAKHISSYILKVEEGTFLQKHIDRYNLPNEDETANMYLLTTEILESKGFNQYEISNYSLKGFESKHNLKYWNLKEYLGLGPAAHSYIGGKRFYYSPDINAFIDGNNPYDDGIGGDEEEYIMLKLRLKEGIKFQEFEEKYNHKLSNDFFEYGKMLTKTGFAIIDDKHIHLTPKGFLISNSIICELIERI